MLEYSNTSFWLAKGEFWIVREWFRGLTLKTKLIAPCGKMWESSDLFFGLLEKNSSPKKLKTQAKAWKSSSKIPKKPQKLPTQLSKYFKTQEKPSKM